MTPMKKPSVPEIVVFDAMTAEAEFRSSIVIWTPLMGFEPLLERTYPVTLSWVPGCTESPVFGVAIAVNPAGGG